MARPLRIEISGGWYQVVARGNDRRRIFGDDRDRLHFVELLAEWVARFGVRLHGYVLMDNHYHLLVETPEANLSQAMQWLGSVTRCGSIGGISGVGIYSRGGSRRW